MKTEPILSRSGGISNWLRRHRGRAIAGLVVASLAMVAISCGTFTGTMLAPPQIPGATFMGSKSCEQCHQEITKKFKTSDHARLMARGENAQDMGCESCHGPASIHNQSGGLAHTIVNPRRDPETCFQCHVDKRGSFSLVSHHPVEDGRVSCGDCHNPHEGRMIAGGTSEASANETCIKCHKQQQGPFIFEHEAMREGCTTCHNPHGTVNQKMLVSRNQDLCLKCHFQQQLNTAQFVIGNQTSHASFVTQGACWSSGCHEAIHGSQVNKHLRF